MNVKEMYPSRFLKASDVTVDTVYTIASVAMETLGMPGDQDVKPIASFRGIDKSLVLNKTNCGVIAELYGDDTDAWTGKQIILYTAQVDFRGKATMAIRVRLAKPTEMDHIAPPAPKQDKLGRGGQDADFSTPAPADPHKVAQADILRLAAALKTMSQQARDAGDIQSANDMDHAIQDARTAYASKSIDDLLDAVAILDVLVNPVPGGSNLPF